MIYNVVFAAQPAVVVFEIGLNMDLNFSAFYVLS